MKIPKGWYRLKKGALIKERDEFWIGGMGWNRTVMAGRCIGDHVTSPTPYIRKLKRRRK